MIEWLIFVGLGFLAASVLGLVIAPLIHDRAVRLTARRLEAATPLSMAEIQADRDQLRAEFAMSTRRLEVSLEQLKNRTSSQLAELGKKTDAINRLKYELGEKSATIFALEAREKALKDQLRVSEDEFAAKSKVLREAEQKLADKLVELDKARAAQDNMSGNSDSQRIQIVALTTQVNAMKEKISGLEKDLKETENRITREKLETEIAAKKLTDERTKVENLGKRVSQLEGQIAAQASEAQILSHRIAELERQLIEQSTRLTERERERDQLRAELHATQLVELHLREQLATIDRRHHEANEGLVKEKAFLDAQVERGREDRAKLQRELAAVKRDTESTWAAERVENALLRERINDVAAEIVRLTAALEGPNSTIDAILAEDTRRVGSTNGAAAATLAPDGKGSLAERIRALQTRASRLSQAT